MDRWIRWKVKGIWSLWHLASHAERYIQTFRGRVPSSVEEFHVQLRDPMAGAVALDLGPRRAWVIAACGFVMPPNDMIEEWAGPAMPPLPRCIWCVHGWRVDTSPPGGGTPARGGRGPRRMIRIMGKRPTRTA